MPCAAARIRTRRCAGRLREDDYRRGLVRRGGRRWTRRHLPLPDANGCPSSDRSTAVSSGAGEAGHKPRGRRRRSLRIRRLSGCWTTRVKFIVASYQQVAAAPRDLRSRMQRRRSTWCATRRTTSANGALGGSHRPDCRLQSRRCCPPRRYGWTGTRSPARVMSMRRGRKGHRPAPGFDACRRGRRAAFSNI